MLAQSGGFLGLFADPHLAATELEGGDPIPVMRQTADALDRFAAPGSELHDVLAPPGVGAEALLRRFSAALRAGADIEDLPLDRAVHAALQAQRGAQCLCLVLQHAGACIPGQHPAPQQQGDGAANHGGYNLQHTRRNMDTTIQCS